MKNLRKIIAVVFIAFVLALTVLLAALPQKAYSPSEKRNLARFPKFSLSSVSDGSFMKGIEDWSADQFAFRDFFMRVKTSVVSVAGQNESHGVYRMRDGSLAEKFSFTDEENYVRTVEALQAFAARYPDVDKYFMLVPNAVSVNSQSLPKNAITDDQNAYIDRFLADLNSGSDAMYKTVDVRSAFISEKNNTQLYYRTDHHWKTEAAKIAYRLLSSSSYMDLKGADRDLSLSTVCNTFSGSLEAESGFSVKTPDSIEIYSFPDDFYYTVQYVSETKRTATCYQADKLEGDDPYQVFFGGNHPLIEIRTSAGTGRKLLVFKDSYANAFIPFLIEDFDEIEIVDPRYYYEDIDALAGAGGFTDILFLYNVNTFNDDTSLKVVLKNNQ